MIEAQKKEGRNGGKYTRLIWSKYFVTIGDDVDYDTVVSRSLTVPINM